MCFIRFAHGLARHGLIQWSDIFYPSKFVFLIVLASTFFYLNRSIHSVDKSENIILLIFKLNIFSLVILSLASVFVFSQFGFVDVFFFPLNILLFHW
jgi:hypothetical protein